MYSINIARRIVNMVDLLERLGCECHLFCETCGYTYETGVHEPDSDFHQFIPGGHYPDCPYGPEEGDED